MIESESQLIFDLQKIRAQCGDAEWVNAVAENFAYVYGQNGSDVFMENFGSTVVPLLRPMILEISEDPELNKVFAQKIWEIAALNN